MDHGPAVRVRWFMVWSGWVRWLMVQKKGGGSVSSCQVAHGLGIWVRWLMGLWGLEGDSCQVAHGLEGWTRWLRVGEVR